MIASEVASDAGGLEAATADAVLLPAAVPRAWQSPPLVATSVGLQMKKLMVPVGVPSALLAAVTTAWSVTDAFTTPEVMLGVVTVVVASGATVTHSPCDASLEPMYVVPDGVYTARKHHTPAWLA